MEITIIGTGYVGLVTGSCLAELGHHVTCVDINKEKILHLKKGELPIYEPGLKDIVLNNLAEKRLEFTDSLKKGITASDIIFIAVGTPEKEDGSADLSYIESVAESIAQYSTRKKIVILKSTAPVGTCKHIQTILDKKNKKVSFDMVSNPEFLREGCAVRDFMVPDRIVVGHSNKRVKPILKEIYSGIVRTGRPLLFTDIHSSEIIKYAANAMLATRISFINMLSTLCEKKKANIKEVARGIGLDERIGSRFLHAGIGYGGSCFPKDVKALISTLEENGCDNSILTSVDHINSEQLQRFLRKIYARVNLKNKIVTVWGLSFKPKTDDIRCAPALTIIKALSEQGAIIHAYDPVAMPEAKKELSNVKHIKLFKNSYKALENAQALIVCTEWDQFRNLDYKKLKKLMKKPVVFDGRNIYDPSIMKKQKVKYHSIGRS